MKVLIITSMPGADEITRIIEEFGHLGHETTVYSTQDFIFRKTDEGFVIPGLSDQTPDIVVVRGILTHLKPIASYVKRLRDSGVKVFDNNFLISRYSISKVTDLVKLSVSEIKIPNTCYYATFEDYYKAAEELGYPMIIKSIRAGKGVGVYKVDDRDELDVLIAEFKSNDKSAKNFVMQEFIDYVYDLRVLVIGDELFTMRRIPPKGDFRANFSLGGTVELYDLDEAGKELALRAMHAVGMSVAGVDILIAKDGTRYILEVNHTAGMKGMESATGSNIVRKYVDHIIKTAH